MANAADGVGGGTSDGSDLIVRFALLPKLEDLFVSLRLVLLI